MAELYPSDAELNALSGTTDSEQEILFVTTGESPYYISFYKMLQRLLKVARRAGDLRVFKDGDLTFGVRAGRYFNGDSTVNYSQVTGESLTNNAVNYIYLTAAGVLTVNTTGFPTPSATPHIPLATIVTSSGAYDGRDVSEGGDIADYRGRAMLSVCGLTAGKLSGDLGTNGHKITTASDNPLILEPHGTGAFQADSGGDARGNYAVDLQQTRGLDTQVASGLRAVIGGGYGNKATNDCSTVGGGYGNTAEGDDSTIAGGESNSADSAHATVGGGYQNSAMATKATIAGGEANEVYSTHGTVSGGKSNDVGMSADYGTVGGGEANEANHNYSTIPGGRYGETDADYDLCWAAGRFAAGGDCQVRRALLRGATTDGAATELTSPVRFTLPDEAAYACTVTILVRRDTGADHAMYKREVLIERTGGTTVLVGAVQTIGTDIESDANFDVTLTADDTNDSLKIEVTGAAAKNLRWAAMIEAVKIAYAD